MAAQNPRPALLGTVMVGLALLGCGPESVVHDGPALVAARRVAVMPAMSPAGPAGGTTQAGVLITTLSAMDYYNVEGPGRLRRAMRQADDKTTAAQTTLARETNVDLIGVCEVLEHRWETKRRSSSSMFGSSQWTERNYFVTVQVRLLSPDGRVLYTGVGSAESGDGFGPATVAATCQALAKLQTLLESAPRRSADAS
jgi:hypothetical protein